MISDIRVQLSLQFLDGARCVSKCILIYIYSTGGAHVKERFNVDMWRWQLRPGHRMHKFTIYARSSFWHPRISSEQIGAFFLTEGE